MRCAFCQAEKDHLKVIDSRSADGGTAIRRRRECEGCGKRFTTYERVDEGVRLAVVKKDGRRVPWDRGKLLAGLRRACFKRPVAEADLEKLADEVEEHARRTHEREVHASVVGKAVVARLRKLDEVAYVRYASVLLAFKSGDDFARAARAAPIHDDDPQQGSLFTPAEEDAPAAPPKANGAPRKRRARVSARDDD